jgi:predicted amidohydrolase
VKVTIACGQFAPVPGDSAANAGKIAAQARDAANLGAAIIVFPELCLCGYPEPAAARDWAVDRQGAVIRRVAECARAAGIAVCFGFAERDGQNLFNSMLFIDESSAVGAVYRKVHLWVNEKSWAAAGKGFSGFEPGPRMPGLRAGMWICYDTRFPECARTLAQSGVTLGLVGSAWFGPAEEWELAVRARAMDNGMYVAAAAVQGSFGTIPFHGGSLIVDPHGRVLARGSEGREQVICADYDSDVVERFRARLPLLSDLRPEAYA